MVGPPASRTGRGRRTSSIEQIHRLLGVPGLRRVLVSAAPFLDWHRSKLTQVLERLGRNAAPAPTR